MLLAPCPNATVTERRPRKRANDRHVARVLAVSLALAVTTTAATPARAQPKDGARAEVLFQEARKLIERKRYADACPKLLESYQIDPAGGTLLNLADCYEKEGKLASALARFREAVAHSQKAGRTERENTARERATRLEPRVPKVTITSASPDVVVRLDGQELDATTLASPVPLDPGEHTVEATSDGKKPFSTKFEAGDRARSHRVEIPALEPVVVAPPDPPPPPRPSTRGNTQRTIGIIVGSVGAAAVGVGAYFGLSAASKWSDARENDCVSDRFCNAEGVELVASAKRDGDVATIVMLSGAALLGGGAALYFLAPRGTTVTASATPGGIVIGGTF